MIKSLVSPTGRAAAKIVGGVLLLATLAILGFVLLATRFMIYDDEGYVLWSVRDFCSGTPLYSEVLSQYGPLFYLGYRALHAVTGVVFDNESGRFFTLAYWLAASGIGGWIAARLSRSTAAGFVAAPLTFFALFNNINEPFHPGSLLAALAALAAALGAHAILANRESRLPWLIAPLAAALALVKLNVGAFLFATLGIWMLLATRPASRAGRLAPVALAPMLALAPFILIKAHLQDTWAVFHAIVFACGALGLLVFSARETRRDLFAAKEWGTAIALPLALGALAAVVTVELGTPWAALMEGAFIAPFRHPNVYVVGSGFRLHHVLFAGCLLLIGWLLGAPRVLASTLGRDMLAVAKLLVGCWLGWQISDFLYGHHLDQFAFRYGPALLPILLIPPDPAASHGTTRASRWVASVFIWQTLQAYPVAGTQMAWGSFLFMPLAVVAWFDAARHLGRRIPGLPRIQPCLQATMAAFAGIGLFQSAAYARTCWLNSEPLDVPGARWLRPPPALATALRVTQRNLARHAEEVFSFPGMFSFNIWTGLPSPTHRNVTHWFTLLDEEEQRAIIRRLEANPKALVVVQRDHVRFLMRTGFPPQGPLKDHILRQMGPLVRIDGYDIWGRRDLRLESVDTFVPRGERTTVCVSAPPRPVASARLLVPDAPARVWTVPAGLTADADGYLRLEFPFAAPRVPTARLELLDSAGAVLTRLPPDLSPLNVSSPPAAN